MRNTETARDDAKPAADASSASSHAFEQTTLLQGLAREWRQNVAGIRRTLLRRDAEPPAAGWADIRRSVSPLESVAGDAAPRNRASRWIESGAWLLLTVIPVAVSSLFALRSKKFRD